MKLKIVINVCLIAWWATTLSVFGQQSTKPNIVFILADDLGWKDLSCYGNPFHETPNLDKLAQNGVRFTQAYAACPVCSPTRASILTGKYPARLRLTNYIAGNRVDKASPVIPPKWEAQLDEKETTLAELLKDKGYTTGMIGKWHLQSKEAGKLQTQGPWAQGFDYSRMIGKNGLDYYNYSVLKDSPQQTDYEDKGTTYLTDKLTDYGVEFIRQNAQNRMSDGQASDRRVSNHPFFLYLAYSAPHIMLIPRADKLSKYMQKYEKFGGKYNPNYGAMLESLDDGVGRIMQTLKEQGLLENTLVIFTSDNGGLGMAELGPTPTTNEPLRKWKGHVYEGGTRIPAIVSWDGKLPKGVVSDTYYSSIDYLPTLCELTGITSLPTDVDGKSQWALFQQPDKTPASQRPLFWHYPHFSNQMGRPAGAVRVGDYKLVELYETGKLELYNLRDDLPEANDLSTKLPDKTRELKKLLSDWRSQLQAQMPLPNPDYNQATTGKN
ncbi:sulfatase [Spirosoma panaciterrae]|uniref:sulfatase n=1 Tax=Spirosoma panaciterrae TaxID=496058 RepID=UPI000374485D|nr:sulfatase [Spirosoma panaciterrae]